MLRIRVLGSLAATHWPDAAPVDEEPVDEEPVGGGAPVELGGPRQRGVLAVLLAAHGRVVSVDRLMDDLWRSEPPPRAIGALQAYVSHLRRGLEPDRAPRAPARVLVSRPPGYALLLPESAVDAWHFESLLRAADGAPAAEARDRLRRALALWRGPAYAEFATEPWAVAEVTRLDALHLGARERLCGALLAGGSVVEAAAEAQALTLEHPMREEGWRLLALALAAGGRQADALAAVRRAREVLAEELGLDPGPGLRRAEADILAGRLPGSEITAEPRRTAGGAGTDGGPTAPTAGAQEPADELLGRSTEVAALLTAAAEAAGPPARIGVALISGEPGAGKSALLGAFGRDLARAGWRVAVGRCPEVDGSPPAWAWVEVLRTLTVGVDPGAVGPALAPLLADSAPEPREAEVAQGRFRLERAVIGYLSRIAAAQPLVVLLDDLHRGDAETVGLLAGIADATAPVAMLLVAAYRTEGGPALHDALADLAVHDPTRVRLGGLPADDAARLIRRISGADPDADTIAALTARTGGNPFYLRESARLLGSEGGLVATSQVPEGVRDVLRRRFARLPDVSVAVLRLAAVLGREVDVEVLVRAAEVDEETVLGALEAGVVTGLLDEPAPEVVRFTHELVRDTLYHDISRLRRSRWHARVATILEQIRPADLAALAHHHGRAETPATARKAVDYAVQAAEQAAGRFAHDATALLLGQAVSALDRVPEATAGHPAGDALPERVGLLARKSLAELAAGREVAALASRREALRLADAADRTDLIVAVLCSWVLPTPWITRTYGNVDEFVVAMVDRALSVPDLTADERCRLLCALVAEIGGERSGPAIAAAAEAEALARAGTDPSLLGLALHARAAVERPESAAGADLGSELIALGRRPGLEVYALIGHRRRLQHAAAGWDADRVAAHLAASGELADRYRWRQALTVAASTRALTAHVAGDLTRAESLYGEVAAALTRHGATDAESVALLAVSTLRMTDGRIGELEPDLRALYAAVPAIAADALAVALLHLGRRAEATAVRRDAGPIRDDFFHSLLLAIRAMAVVGLAEVGAAREVYDDLARHQGELAGGGSGSFTVGPVDTWLGGLAALLGRPDVAVAHYETALTLAERCGNPFWVRQARRGIAGGGRPL